MDQETQASQKKEYQTPNLSVLGDVREVTRTGGGGGNKVDGKFSNKTK